MQLQALGIGQEIWGYISSKVTLCGTDRQEYGEVLRVEGGYRARVAGRHDGTGFEKEYKTLQAAMAAAHLLQHSASPVAQTSDSVFQLQTCFTKAGK